MVNLSREQLRAFNSYLSISKEHFPILQASCYQLTKCGALLPTDFRAGSLFPFEKTSLPREPHWAWNQSNAKVCVRGTNNELVTFIKITPRRRFLDLLAPNFKIWLFHAHYPSQDLYFLWCEKGLVPPMENGISTEIGMVFPEELTLGSLAFLAPFVDPLVARELGWKTSR